MMHQEHLYCLLPENMAHTVKAQAEHDQAGITVLPLKEAYSLQFNRRLTAPDGHMYAVVPIVHRGDYQSFWKTLTRAEFNKVLQLTVAVRGLIRNRAGS